MLLTDEEIKEALDKVVCCLQDRDIAYARAIESAVLAKLREQEPVGWITPDGEGWRIRFSPPVTDTKLGWSAIFEHPAPIPEGWISVEDRLPEVGRTPILVAVSWVKYGEHEDGTPTEATGVDVTEGEYVPAHNEAGGYFDSYQGSHGDSQYITHWMPLPKPPIAAERSGE